MDAGFAIQKDYPWVRLNDDFAFGQIAQAHELLQGRFDTGKLLRWETLGWVFTNLPEEINSERAGILLKDGALPLLALPDGAVCFDIRNPLPVSDLQGVLLFTIVGLHPGNQVGIFPGTIPHVELRFEEAGQQLLQRLALLNPQEK